MACEEGHGSGSQAEEEHKIDEPIDEQTRLLRLEEAKKALTEERRRAAALKQLQKAEMERRLREKNRGAQTAQGRKQRDGKATEKVSLEAGRAAEEVPALSEEQLRLDEERQAQEKEARAAAAAVAAAERRATVALQAEKNMLKQQQRERAAQREEETQFVWAGEGLAKTRPGIAAMDSLARSQDGVPKGLVGSLNRWLDRT